MKCRRLDCGWCVTISRSPCGERGLKLFARIRNEGDGNCRSPCGERGLKLQWRSQILEQLPSLPVRGAWVEIRNRTMIFFALRRSPCGERGLKYLHMM